MTSAGFLLAPEIIRWQEPLMDGNLSEPFFVAQKRICFTELAETELAEHASRFGPFSIEYTLPALRRLGAIPVFYVPRGTTDDYAESIGNALLARMLEVEQALARLAQMASIVSTASRDEETLALTILGGQLKTGH